MSIGALNIDDPVNRFAALPLGCAHDVEDPTVLRYRSGRAESVIQEISVTARPVNGRLKTKYGSAHFAT